MCLQSRCCAPISQWSHPFVKPDSRSASPQCCAVADEISIKTFRRIHSTSLHFLGGQRRNMNAATTLSAKLLLLRAVDST